MIIPAARKRKGLSPLVLYTCVGIQRSRFEMWSLFAFFLFVDAHRAWPWSWSLLKVGSTENMGKVGKQERCTNDSFGQYFLGAEEGNRATEKGAWVEQDTLRRAVGSVDMVCHAVVWYGIWGVCEHEQQGCGGFFLFFLGLRKLWATDNTEPTANSREQKWNVSLNQSVRWDEQMDKLSSVQLRNNAKKSTVYYYFDGWSGVEVSDGRGRSKTLQWWGMTNTLRSIAVEKKKKIELTMHSPRRCISEEEPRETTFILLFRRTVSMGTRHFAWTWNTIA